jgi:1-acylglycerone phosphate reductase
MRVCIPSLLPPVLILISMGSILMDWIGIYNASKAALAHFTATIALELKPLGVTTVTVMAGMVQSSWYSNSMPQIELPEDSYYHLATDAINAGMQGDDNKKNGMNVDAFAEQVVKSVVNGSRGKIWAGAMAPLVKWVTGWLPVWVAEKICWDRGDLGKLVSEMKRNKGA